MFQQIHLTNLSVSIGHSWREAKYWVSWRRLDLKTSYEKGPLNSSLCAVTIDWKSLLQQGLKKKKISCTSFLKMMFEWWWGCRRNLTFITLGSENKWIRSSLLTCLLLLVPYWSDLSSFDVWSFSLSSSPCVCDWLFMISSRIPVYVVYKENTKLLWYAQL